MRFLINTLVAGIVFSVIGCASGPNTIDTSRLTLVEENHATITANGISYVLDSYIILFQQPYYIKVTRGDKKAMPLKEAIEVAEQYIKPRGCTQPLSRRQDLDRFNSDKTQWLIGIEC